MQKEVIKMATLVMGGTGRTGSEIVQKLLKDGKQVIVGSHSNSLNVEWDSKLVTMRIFDLIEDDVATIAEKLVDVDVIIFASGASQKRPDLAEWIDLDGAVKLMDAAKQLHIKRYLMVSAAGAADRATWNIYDIPEYYIAKYYAEQMLKNSGLIYTVVRPPILSNDSITGKVALENVDNGEVISRADVAAVIVKAIENPHTYNQAFDLYKSNQTIEQIFDQLK